MLAPEKQQIEICLLKSNLEEIENDLVNQRSALPTLDTEYKKKCRDTMAALNVVRALNTEQERLKQENMRLSVKRMQLKQQCDKIMAALEKVNKTRDDINEVLMLHVKEIEDYIRKYEDSMQEKAERFRKTFCYYNREEINTEIDKLNSEIADLKDVMNMKQNVVDELSARMDSIRPEVPENLVEEMFKLDLYEKLKSVTKEYEDLVQKRQKK